MSVLDDDNRQSQKDEENVHTDFSEALNVDFQSRLRGKQKLPGNIVQASDIIQVLSLFDPYGYWHLNLHSRKLYWSEDIYKIYGMTVPHDHMQTPVDVDEAISAYHPDDAIMLPQLLEDTAARQSGFRAVMRLKRRVGGYKLVKATGMFRKREDGLEEIFGTISEFQPANRSIAVI